MTEPVLLRRHKPVGTLDETLLLPFLSAIVSLSYVSAGVFPVVYPLGMFPLGLWTRGFDGFVGVAGASSCSCLFLY